MMNTLLLIAAMAVVPITSAFPTTFPTTSTSRRHQNSLRLFAHRPHEKKGYYSKQQLRSQEGFVCDMLVSSRFSMLYDSLEEYPYGEDDYPEDYPTYDATTETQMDDILWELSCTESDHIRRLNLAAILEKEHANANSWEDFAKLFESRLSIMGEIAQKEVKTQLNQNIRPSERGKVKKNWIQKQLWACVDMMVQSKTIIKRCETIAIPV